VSLSPYNPQKQVALVEKEPGDGLDGAFWEKWGEKGPQAYHHMVGSRG
jgi:hypothetical protein